MKKIIYIVLIFIGSCKEPGKKVISDSKGMEFESIELIDTFSNQLVFDKASSLTEAAFHPMYIGMIKDSIPLNYWSGEIKTKSFSWDEFKKPNSADLNVYVDTNQIIGSVNRFIPLPPLPLPPNLEEKERTEKKWEKQVYRGEIKSYPIFIKNKTKDTLNISYGDYIPLIIEAIDSLGEWKPIQEPYIYFCGTGLSYFYLPSEEIALTSCKLFEGNYETTMRITFGFDKRIKSNVFKAKMNYEQFIKDKHNY